jgi:hypothetical protein
MYQQYLMRVRHDDRLRTAAKDQLAEQARRARAARRRETEPRSLRRLMRKLERLAYASPRSARQFSAQLLWAIRESVVGLPCGPARQRRRQSMEP